MLSIHDINFLEKDYPQLRGQRNKLLNQNKDLYQQVNLQAVIIKLMALKLRESFAEDIEINKVIKYYEKLAQKEIKENELYLSEKNTFNINEKMDTFGG